MTNYLTGIYNFKYVRGYGTAYLFFQGEWRKVKIKQPQSPGREAVLVYLDKKLILYGSGRHAYLDLVKSPTIANFYERLKSKPGGFKLGKATFWALGPRSKLRIKHRLPEA